MSRNEEDQTNESAGGQNGDDGDALKIPQESGDTDDDDKNAAAATPAPNSKPRETDPEEDTYVYRDFATIPAPNLNDAALHPQSLQAQKLPARLASMLSDHDMSGVIIWLPHGRSWRVLNRDLFADHALPRYFGHKNYASFVRIVNAWGFRRITRGSDRDSYYHELFLRGRPDLHQRMKRLSTCHRKTPVHKEDKCPDFYELAKASPLPEVALQRGAQTNGGGVVPNAQLGPAAVNHRNASGQLSQLPPHLHGVPVVPGPAVASLGNFGGPMGNINEQVLSLLTNDVNARSMNAVHPAPMPGNSQPSLPRLAQLQRDNEDLRRRIMEIESAQSQQGGNQQHPMAPDQFAGLSSNIANGGNNAATAGGGTNDALERELERMQRDFRMRSGTPMNNSMNNSLLSSLGGGAGGGGGAPAAPGGSNARDFSFMSGFPRDEMLIRAMRLENQMGYLQQQPGSQASSTTSTLERALQQHQNQNSAQTMPPAPSAAPVVQTDDDRRKAMMDWVAKQQQHGLQ
eukprot:CAMPEP_0172310812 /NCGR_PEP_ID=MMETSP1058-20130122/12699_1 /TAXON_ID=83371 /ORGANISM="Detonula confervacea, Strain CCMP 353" /LENGTH=514 /DNA_ID=CAMNT_0013023755 /DNA_START=97 /DNA_END=1641 /DNA_ORIENTATION=+